MTQIRNRIGFHFGSNSNATGWQSYIDRLDAAGIPATLMSTGGEGFGDIARRWDNGSTVPHLAVIRCLTHNDVPRYDLPIANAVTDWLTRYAPTIGPDVKRYHTRVITKHGNELDKNRIQWLAEFYTALHPALLKQMGWANHRISVFNFASGEPEPEQWGTIKPFLELCGANSDKFVIGLHEYSYNSVSLSASYPWLIGRVKFLYDYCDANGIQRPLTCAHEFGWQATKIATPTSTALAQIDAAMAMYADIGPEWLGGGIWTLQPWQDSGVNNEVQKLIDPVTLLTLDRWYETNEVTPPPPITLPKIVILKKPAISEFTLTQNQQAGEWAYKNYGRTATHSQDDMARMLTGGDKVTSYAVIANPSSPSQAGAIAWCNANGYKYQTINFNEAPVYFRLNVPHISQNGTGASARINDCGAACTAMVVRVNSKTPTVDQVAIAYQSPANSYMSFTQIDAALNGYGMDGVHKRPYYARDINNTVFAGKPVICLVWYQSLPQRFSTFNGSHFIVVYGGNGTDLLYRDPLATNSSDLHITYSQLDKAMADAAQGGNYPNQGMDCSVKVASYDLLSYLKGDGRLYEVRNSSGSQERFQTQAKVNGEFWQTKNALAEQLKADSNYIYRGWDTSPGANRYYQQQQPKGTAWAQWLPRTMALGQSFSVSLWVQFYNWDCTPSVANSGAVTDTRRLVAHYASWTSPYGIVLQDVIKLEWVNGAELYWYARGFGLVGWSRTNNDPNTPASSGISELHQPGDRPDNVVNLPVCLR